MTLSEIRKKKDICNARQAAKQLGISYRQYHRIELGHSRLDDSKAEKLSQIYGVPVTEIYKAWEEAKSENDKTS